ncbi:MAG: hypothetical protein Q8K99_12690 [Actinomycetota bacterium]|nr:hypothetical protein [Actinomycetota bacterium]
MSDSLDKYHDPPEAVDPYLASTECLLVVLFPRSNSKNYPIALNIARGSARFAETDFTGKPMNMAAFASSPDDARRAVALLEYVRQWKGVMVFSGGKLVKNTWQLLQVVDCSLDASSCDDPSAHCDSVIDDPLVVDPQDMGLSVCIRLVAEPPEQHAVEIDRYLFPCKFLQNRFHFQPDHPSSLQNQIQAAAVEMGCNMCPCFDPNRFGRVGSRTVMRDGPDPAPWEVTPRFLEE